MKGARAASTTPDGCVDARGLGRRLSNTPVRDVLRGRITGRLDTEWVVGREGLPARTEALVLEVVRRTRLWRGEQVDVARELAAHFRDAFNAGSGEMEAIEGFGDAATAAKLIRRATRRKRPLAWKIWVRAWACLGLVLLAAAAWTGWRAAWYSWGEPTISRNYLAELNAEILKTPEGERAWPVYREALIALGNLGAPPLTGRTEEPDLWTLADEHPLWISVGQYLAAAEPAFERLSLAESKSDMGYLMRTGTDPLVGAATEGLLGRAAVPEEFESAEQEENPALVGVLLPHLSLMRMTTNILSDIEVPAAVRAGDAPRVERAVSAQLSMARHLCGCPTLIDRLVGVSLCARAAGTLNRTLAEAPGLLDESSLVRLAHRLSIVRVDRSLRMERLMGQDVVQRAYTDDGNGDGVVTRRLAAFGFSDDPKNQPGFSPMAPGRREVQDGVDRYYRLAQEHLLGATNKTEFKRQIRDLLDARGRFRNPVLGGVAVSVERARESFDRGEMLRDAALLAIGAEVYRRRHGAYPDDVRASIPDLLPGAPADRLRDPPAPLRVVVCDGVLTVYSVGDDGIDDGGVFRSVDPRSTKPPDLRLWPVAD